MRRSARSTFWIERSSPAAAAQGHDGARQGEPAPEAEGDPPPSRCFPRSRATPTRDAPRPLVVPLVCPGFPGAGRPADTLSRSRYASHVRPLLPVEHRFPRTGRPPDSPPASGRPSPPYDVHARPHDEIPPRRAHAPRSRWDAPRPRLGRNLATERRHGRPAPLPAPTNPRPARTGFPNTGRSVRSPRPG